MNIRIGDRSYGVKSYIKNFDKVLLGLIAVLLVFSMLCINSATYGSDAHSRSMIVQGVAIGLGFVLMIIVSKLDYDIISDLWKYIVVASSAALFLTALIAPEINGNRNWLMIGSVNIQTSEFTKICFAVTMSKHLAKLGEDLNKPKNILFVLIHFLAYLVPILLQGDIGTALIYIGIFVVLVFAAGIYYRYILIGALGVAGITPLLWNMMKDYQKLRILYGFQPELDPLGKGYQPLVSRMAIGSGQLWGLGYQKGIQAQNSLLPEIRTDFIYAIVGEEWGFVGCVFVLLVLVTIVLLIFRNARKAKNQMGFFICIAVASTIMFQTLINIGMCIGVLPVIGVTLPFFSYGGSSVLALLISVGLVQAVCVKPDRSLKFGMR